MTNLNNLNFNLKNPNTAWNGAEKIDYNKKIIPLFNSPIVLKKIDDSNRNLSLNNPEDKLIIKVVSINDKLSEITNSIKKIQLNTSNELSLSEKNNKFNFIFNLLIRKNELYKLRLEFFSVIYRINNLLNIFYLNNNSKEINSFTNIKTFGLIANNFNLVQSKLNLRFKSLFVPKHLIIKNSSNYYYNKENLNLELLQKKINYSSLNNSNSKLAFSQIVLEKKELNILLEKLNLLHLNIENLIEKNNKLIEIFNFNKIFNNLKAAEILNTKVTNNSVSESAGETNFNKYLNTEIKNFSLIDFYLIFNYFKNMSSLHSSAPVNNNLTLNNDNFIFNLLPYVYSINNDSNINYYDFSSNLNKHSNINYLASLSSGEISKEITPSKENKIRMEETMKSIFNRYTLNSSNDFILENKLTSAIKSNNQLNNLNNISSNLSKENISNVSRKNLIKDMVSYLITKINTGETLNINLEQSSAQINNFFGKSINISSILRSRDNLSPVKIFYYPEANYNEFAKGFVLNKLLNKQNTSLPEAHTNLTLETRNEYSNWLQNNKKPIISQYLKAMSNYNLRKTGTFLYFTNIFSYNFINNNNKMIKNIYKLLSFVFKSMYSLISKPVFSITPNKVIIHLFYFLLIPNILKKKLSNKMIKKNKSLFINKIKTKNKNKFKKKNSYYLPVAKKQLFKLINGLAAPQIKKNSNSKINLFLNNIDNSNNNNLINYLTLNIQPLANKINEISIKNNIVKIQEIIFKINIIIKLINKYYSQISNNEIKKTLKLKLIELYNIKNSFFLIYFNNFYLNNNQILAKNEIVNLNNSSAELSSEVVNNNTELNTIIISNYKKYYNKENLNIFLNNNSIFKTRKYNLFFINHINNKLNLIKNIKLKNPNLFKQMLHTDNYLLDNILNKLKLSVIGNNKSIINTKNKNILTFNRKLKNKKNIFIKNNHYWKIFRLRKKFNSLNLKKRIKLIKLYNISLINLYPKKFESLCNILNYCFKKNVVIDLTRIHYPYNDANILVNMLAIMIRKISFRRITRKLFRNTIIKNVKKLFYFNNYNLLPSFLTGLKIKLGGKVMNFRSKSRNNVKIAERGSSSTGKVNYTDFARYTNKHKRGAFSISISSGQNFY